MNTVAHPFMSCNREQQNLFSVNPGIDQQDALDLAKCFLTSAAGSIVEAEGDIGQNHAYLIAYTLEFAEAILESMQRAALKTQVNREAA